MEPSLEYLIKEKETLVERVRKLDEAIKVLKEMCEHDMKYYGNDSHHEYYECTKCGHLERK